MIADVLLSNLVATLGWKHGNDVFTYIGVGLLILVILLIRDNPKHVKKFHYVSPANFSSMLQKLLEILMNIKFWAASLVGASIFIPINVLGSLWAVGFIEAKLDLSTIAAADINSLLFIGAAVGFAVFGIISAFTTRFRFLLMLSIISLAIISLILIYIPMSKNTFIVFYFLLGVMAGPQAVTFTIARMISPPGTSGSSTAGVNMVNNLMPVILLPGIGYILSTYGTMVDSDSYTIVSYQIALLTILILLIVCIPIAMLLPKRVDI